MDQREWRLLSDERDAWYQRLDGDAAMARKLGYDDGWEAGYLAACEELKRINALLPLALDVELARWGPRGRHHFGDPRPGDYPGEAASG